MTHKPATEDYVPLFPWTGVLLIGLAVGHALAPRLDRLAPLARLPRGLATMDATVSSCTCSTSRFWSHCSRLATSVRRLA